ncbi:MAG: hypothetical protein PPP58_01375 [Natronomonas sp.]
MNPNALPIALQQTPQWLCWASRRRNGKQTKMPLDPADGEFASTADPSTWGTFDEALQRATRPEITGIGFVFTREDPYVGIDIDDCRDPETATLTDDAVDIVTKLHSFTEISPSGTGLHVIARGELPEGPRRHGAVEMYDEKRFFTMTGRRLFGTPETVCDRPGPIKTVHRRYLVTEETTDGERPSGAEYEHAASLDDHGLLQKAQMAENGPKFHRLWRGNTGGYESHSEADMALCCLLAFWTGGDTGRVDQLFRDSGLMRPKWDEVHYTDGATYGERTVERACQRVSDGYGDG